MWPAGPGLVPNTRRRTRGRRDRRPMPVPLQTPRGTERADKPGPRAWSPCHPTGSPGRPAPARPACPPAATTVCRPGAAEGLRAPN